MIKTKKKICAIIVALVVSSRGGVCALRGESFSVSMANEVRSLVRGGHDRHDHRRRRLLHPMHHGHGGTSYLGCLNYTDEELAEEWIFPGNAPNCSYTSYMNGDDDDDDDDGSDFDDDGPNDDQSGNNNDENDDDGGDDDGGEGDDANGGNGENGDGNDDGNTGNGDDDDNEGSNDDEYSNNDDVAYGNNANDGRNSGNGGYVVTNEDIAEGNNDGNENPMESFDITECDTYSNLWVWDLAFSCDDDVTLDNCECTFTEQMMQEGMITCNDIKKCPRGCSVCETCFKLVGCAPADNTFGNTGISTSTVFAIAAAVCVFLLGVCYYYARNTHGFEENSLEAGLLDKGLQESPKKPFPAEIETNDVRRYNPQLEVPQYISDNRSDLSSLASENHTFECDPSTEDDTGASIDEVELSPIQGNSIKDHEMNSEGSAEQPIGLNVAHGEGAASQEVGTMGEAPIKPVSLLTLDQGLGEPVSEWHIDPVLESEYSLNAPPSAPVSAWTLEPELDEPEHTSKLATRTAVTLGAAMPKQLSPTSFAGGAPVILREALDPKREALCSSRNTGGLGSSSVSIDSDAGELREDRIGENTNESCDNEAPKKNDGVGKHEDMDTNDNSTCDGSVFTSASNAQKSNPASGVINIPANTTTDKDSIASDESPGTWIGDIDLSGDTGDTKNADLESALEADKDEIQGSCTHDSPVSEASNVWLVPLEDLDDASVSSNKTPTAQEASLNEHASSTSRSLDLLVDSATLPDETTAPESSVVWLAPSSAPAELVREEKDDNSSVSSWSPDDSGPWLAPV